VPKNVEANAWAAQLMLAAEQAQRRQNVFVATAVHELRGPLAPISAAASMLGRIGCDDAATLGRLQEIIQRQVVHLSRLIDDLLDLSRSSTGKLRLQRSIVDLRDLVAAGVEACRPAAQRRGQQLVVVLPPTALQVDGDALRLSQVIGNLLDNASKFTPRGGTISLLAALHGDLVLLTVADDGMGISDQALDGIFRPFAQDLSRAAADDSGLGLGLAVVSELVSAHGGSVVVHSAGAGRGNRFVVTLPHVPGAPSAPEVREQALVQP
jgi:signal transduction histidine kinase